MVSLHFVLFDDRRDEINYCWCLVVRCHVVVMLQLLLLTSDSRIPCFEQLNLAHLLNRRT